jgi:hypothetical protein
MWGPRQTWRLWIALALYALAGVLSSAHGVEWLAVEWAPVRADGCGGPASRGTCELDVRVTAVSQMFTYISLAGSDLTAVCADIAGQARPSAAPTPAATAPSPPSPHPSVPATCRRAPAAAATAWPGCRRPCCPWTAPIQRRRRCVSAWTWAALRARLAVPCGVSGEQRRCWLACGAAKPAISCCGSRAWAYYSASSPTLNTAERSRTLHRAHRPHPLPRPLFYSL